MILESDKNGKLEDVDTGTCLQRIRIHIIKFLIGDMLVMANVRFNFLDREQYAFLIQANNTCIYNTRFPKDEHTVKITNNPKGTD
jgi:hypothetical protein